MTTETKPLYDPLDTTLSIPQLQAKYSPASDPKIGQHPHFTTLKMATEKGFYDPKTYWTWVFDRLTLDMVKSDDTRPVVLTDKDVPEIRLTANQLMVKYDTERDGSGQHPRFTKAMFDAYVAAPHPDEQYGTHDYWIWLRNSIAEEFTQNASQEQITAEQSRPDLRTEHEKALDAKAYAMDHPPLLIGTRVDVADGKYSVIMSSDGHMQALRYGEVWKARPITGDKFIHCMALELHEARQQLQAHEEQFAKSNKTLKELLTAIETLKKEVPWPVEEMTTALKEVLSLPNYRCGPIAHVFVKAGFTIPSESAEEQAFVLHRYVGYALKHKENWKAVAEAELQRLGAPTHNKVHVPEKDVTPVNDGKLILPGQ